MRNNLLNFAEFERETIAARVADAYNTKARETGFYQGGKMYYGYDSERRKVNGKTGSVLIPSEQAESVRIAFQMYQSPDCSLKDIIEYFQDNDIVTRRTGNYKSKGRINQSHVSLILESPLYVRADKDVYAYFQSMGYEIIDEIEAYDGIHGVFSHKDNEGKTYVKIGYHDTSTGQEFDPYQTYYLYVDDNSVTVRPIIINELRDEHEVDIAVAAVCGYVDEINYINSHSSH